MQDILDLVIASLIMSAFIVTAAGLWGQRFGFGSRPSLFREHMAALRLDGYGNIDAA